MKNLFKLLFIFFLATIFLSGCYDKVELEDRDFVMSLGIDLNENSENKISLSAITTNDYKQEECNILTSFGKTFDEALENLDNISNKKIYLGHTKLIVLSEKVLKNQYLFKEIINSSELLTIFFS